MRTVFVIMLPMKQSANAYQVKKSSAGLGLFATTHFKKGDVVIEYTGEHISHDEADRRGGRYLFTLSDSIIIDGKDRKNIARYINHACKPNCYAEIDENEEHICIFAKRAIKPGEEITFHYGAEYKKDIIDPVGCKCATCLNT